MKSFKKIIAAIIVVTCAFTIACLTPSTNTYAAASICDQDVRDEIKAANGCEGTEIVELQDVVIGIINGVVAVLGLVSVVFIIVGGVNYMTSTGDSTKLEKAKKTILYAVIGLIICVLAFAIVNFVVANIIGSEPATPPSP